MLEKNWRNRRRCLLKMRNRTNMTTRKILHLDLHSTKHIRLVAKFPQILEEYPMKCRRLLKTQYLRQKATCTWLRGRQIIVECLKAQGIQLLLHHRFMIKCSRLKKKARQKLSLDQKQKEAHLIWNNRHNTFASKTQMLMTLWNQETPRQLRVVSASMILIFWLLASNQLTKKNHLLASTIIW